MKMKSFLIPALALALAGCANEELETIGSGTIPAVPSGQTILFSNNTALTIGDADGDADPCDGMDGSDGQGEQCLLA